MKRRAAEARLAGPGRAEDLPRRCALCGRPLGRLVEWHHPVPRSRGGRDTVPVHPICHRAIHARFTNQDLAAHGGDLDPVRTGLGPFLRFVAGKPPDFHAPTRPARD